MEPPRRLFVWERSLARIEMELAEELERSATNRDYPTTTLAPPVRLSIAVDPVLHFTLCSCHFLTIFLFFF